MTKFTFISISLESHKGHLGSVFQTLHVRLGGCMEHIATCTYVATLGTKSLGSEFGILKH